jgi:hypothetical protein
MNLKRDETRLDGEWVFRGGRMVADATCERIKDLVTSHLEKVTTDRSGWDTLYRDPEDGRYWELVYLHSEMHGGGPPSLILVEKDAIKEKYGIV